MNQFPFALSAALNAALLGLLLAEPEGEASSFARTTDHGTVATPVAEDARALKRELERIGLDDRLIKPLVLASVLETAEAAISPAVEYWRHTPERARARALALEDARDVARAEVSHLYGPRAKEDPAFSALFRPLGSRFAFLSADEQLAVQRLRLERVPSARPGLSPRPNVAQRGPSDATHDGFSAQLAKLIGRRAALEYELRESPLAHMLQTSGLELTEPQYRAAYSALRALGQADLSQSDFLAARAKLRAALGAPGFTRLWSAYDPKFGVVEQVGRRAGLTADQILSAYAILNDAQDELMRTLGEDGGNAEQQARTVRELQARNERRLAELIGAEVAARLLDALARPAGR